MWDVFFFFFKKGRCLFFPCIRSPLDRLQRLLHITIESAIQHCTHKLNVAGSSGSEMMWESNVSIILMPGSAPQGILTAHSNTPI